VVLRGTVVEGFFTVVVVVVGFVAVMNVALVVVVVLRGTVVEGFFTVVVVVVGFVAVMNLSKLVGVVFIKPDGALFEVFTVVFE
jgi:hypothetical protein